MAEDLTQDVFLRAWRAAPRWQPLGRVSTWLFQIAKRHWWNEAAKLKLRRKIRGVGGPPGVGVWEDPAAHVAGQDLRPEERLARVEATRAIEAALTRVRRRLRLVFVLVRLEGCSLAEAAQIAGVPVGTVKSRVAAAEATLRRRLRPY